LRVRQPRLIEVATRVMVPVAIVEHSGSFPVLAPGRIDQAGPIQNRAW
jgi:hypothetical protein